MSGRRSSAPPKKVRPLVVQSYEPVPLRCGHEAIGLPEIDTPKRQWWCDECRVFSQRKSGGKR